MSDEREHHGQDASGPERGGERAWDVSDVDEWGPDRHEPGAVIPDAGNSTLVVTGGWRTLAPAIDLEACDGCLLCYFYCPDASIVVEDDKPTGIDLDHCKGCGICASECPRDAITMKPEDKG